MDNRKQKCKNRSSIKEFQYPKEKKDREDEGGGNYPAKNTRMKDISFQVEMACKMSNTHTQTHTKGLHQTPIP